eukprot:scaffold31889_cov64-Phaeocystis_antarctica.AAC.5
MWWTEHAAQVQRCSAVAASDAGDREGDISEKLLAPSSQLLGAAGELLQHGGDLLVAAGAGARDGASELVERYASELRAATEGGAPVAPAASPASPARVVSPTRVAAARSAALPSKGGSSGTGGALRAGTKGGLAAV